MLKCLENKIRKEEKKAIELISIEYSCTFVKVLINKFNNNIFFHKITFTRYSGNKKYAELDEWIKFIENPEVIDMENTNKEVKKAKEVLKEISQDEHERYLTELRQKYILDQKAIEDAGYDKRI